MSFRQIFDRIARLARSEIGSSRGSDFERELRRAEELIEESRRPRRTTVDVNDQTGASRATASHDTPAYTRACEVLGVKVNATRTEIAAAYRQSARMYHPDRVSNLPAEEQSAALRKMQALNLAYEYLERHAPR